MADSYIARFAGCCEPVNPGGTMGFGAFIIKNGATIKQVCGIAADCEDGGSSNSLADYAACLSVLDYFIEAGLTNADIETRGHSKLVVEQMNGAWQIGPGSHALAAHKTLELSRQFSNLRFQWTPRAENHEAAELARSELIKAGIDISERGPRERFGRR